MLLHNRVWLLLVLVLCNKLHWESLPNASKIGRWTAVSWQNNSKFLVPAVHRPIRKLRAPNTSLSADVSFLYKALSYDDTIDNPIRFIPLVFQSQVKPQTKTEKSGSSTPLVSNKSKTNNNHHPVPLSLHPQFPTSWNKQHNNHPLACSFSFPRRTGSNGLRWTEREVRGRKRKQKRKGDHE